MDNSANRKGSLRRAVALAVVLASSACSRLDAPSSAPVVFTPGPTFTGSASSHMGVGLTSIAADTDRIRVSWRSTNLSSFAGDFALYLSTDRDTLFSAAATPLDITLGEFIFPGLLGQTEYFIGIGLAATTGAPLIPVGTVLSAKTGVLYYVDPAAPAAGADGLTPASAFPAVFPAIITAFLNGGGNVLVLEGQFMDTSLPLLAGVDLYGGYGPGFLLEDRDPEGQATRFVGLAGSSVLRLEAIGLLQRVDGIHIDGLGASINGIDLDQTPAQLSNLDILNCARGIRLRSANIFDPTEVRLADVLCANNRLEGLSLQGTFSLDIDNSTFQSNGQEGLQFGPWMAPSGESVSLNVRNCRFLANGSEGFDVDLASVPVIGAGGRFKINITDCDFEQNLSHGCLIDVDYETTPAWQLELSLRGSRALANGVHGFALDIDSTATCTLHRLLSSANGQDGLSVTSETYAAMVLVSASAFVGNLRYGARSSFGNVGIAFSHCLFLGNATGGLRDEIAPASISSTAAQLQNAPFGTAHTRGSLGLPDAPISFLHAAIEYRDVNAQLGDTLTLDTALGSGLGMAAEVASDGILRTLDASAGTSIQLGPSPMGLRLPALLAIFSSSNSVDEDYRPQAGSPLLGAGMLPPTQPATDAGPFGSPAGGAPGAEDMLPSSLFRVSAQTPAWGQPIGANSALQIAFMGGIPDSSSLADGLRAVDAMGIDLSISAAVQGNQLVLQPPAGGWQRGDLIELHGEILSAGNALPLLPITLLVGAD